MDQESSKPPTEGRADGPRMSPIRSRVLGLVLACGSPYGITVVELADQAMRSEKTVYAHLNALAALGLVRHEDVTTGRRGRPKRAWFGVTPGRTSGAE